MSWKRTIVLIGASIGKAWDLARFAERTGRTDLRVFSIARFHPDKTEAVEAVLSDEPLPDVVILKQCAAYFPGDVDDYLGRLGDWIGRCRERGVEPVPATVCPVVVRTGWPESLRSLRRRLRGRPTPEARQRSLTAYNDSVRALARTEDLHVLDLELALSRASDDRRLADEFDSGDGLHLNAAGYARLDLVLGELIDRIGERRHGWA